MSVHKEHKLGNPYENNYVKLRFYSFITIPEDESLCWEWNGYKDKDGYGKFTYDKRQRPAHRIMWQLDNGPIEDGMWVLHDPDICNNPSCCNPDHLRLGTQRDNEDDKIKIGSSKSVKNSGFGIGLKNHSRYVNVSSETAAEIVNRIRVNGEYMHKVAADYDFSISVVRRILQQFDGTYKQTDCYIAGPFFTKEEELLIYKIEIACKRAGLSFFSPRLRGGVIKDMSPTDRKKYAKKIYDMNVLGIERTKCIIGVIDNYDSGTVWEIGFAAGLNKKIITLTDKNYGLNVMLSKAVNNHVSTIDDAINAVLGKPFIEFTPETIT